MGIKFVDRGAFGGKLYSGKKNPVRQTSFSSGGGVIHVFFSALYNSTLNFLSFRNFFFLISAFCNFLPPLWFCIALKRSFPISAIYQWVFWIICYTFQVFHYLNHNGFFNFPANFLLFYLFIYSFFAGMLAIGSASIKCKGVNVFLVFLSLLLVSYIKVRMRLEQTATLGQLPRDFIER